MIERAQLPETDTKRNGIPRRLPHAGNQLRVRQLTKEVERVVFGDQPQSDFELQMAIGVLAATIDVALRRLEEQGGDAERVRLEKN